MLRTTLLLAASSLLLSGCLAMSVGKAAVKTTGAVVKGGVAVGKAVIP